MVNALAPGTFVADRFEIVRVLGRGGFSIVYEVRDLRRGDLAVLKELVPPGATRNADGLVDLGLSGTSLRQTFLEEAKVLGRLNVAGILPIRLAFVANGTAYTATERVEGAQTLDTIVRSGGGMDPDGVLDLAYQLIETLRAVHAKGLLHRDVKPNNVLVAPDGKAYLLDFGSARAWSADAEEAHTVIFTKGYAPPEQLSAVARRGPTVDVYGLCATLYAALTGHPPEDAAARLAGQPLTPLRSLRPELDPDLTGAIEAGLALRAGDRPGGMDELRKRLDGEAGAETLASLESLDALLLRAQRFAYDRRACPACGGVLEEVRPLPKDACPVCHRGRIRSRRFDLRQCPVCRHGVLLRAKQGRGPFGKVHPSAELACDACPARFETLGDGRLQERATGRALYPDGWAKVAAGLDPEAGSAACDHCDAEFDLHGDRITLLRSFEDPHGFAKAYGGRPLARERLPWLAVGKQSPNSGLVCDRCPTEFNHVGRALRLIASDAPRLARHEGETRTLESWHRIGEGLPEAGREAELEDRIAETLGAAYRRGEVQFGDAVWRGTGRFEDRPVPFVIRDGTLRLGKGLRIRRFDLRDLSDLEFEGDWIFAEGPGGRFELQVDPVELVAHLRSGDRAVLLTAADLAARLGRNVLGSPSWASGEAAK